jgi:UDP-N-acetylmuramoylalanine--D-glutamate ligase
MTLKVAGQQFLVIGAGRTGQSTARFLLRYGARVRLAERTPDVLERVALPDGIEVCVGDTAEELLDGVDLVVPSPGVARGHVLLRRAVGRGLPVLSEIELASRALTCPILAVTGTNGKSTTTVLLGAMLKEAGMHVFVGGNLGTPLIDACLEEQKLEAAVVEVSSFQLEWVCTFRAQVALLLNLTPDHLDRYSDVREYQRAKAALFVTQQPGDVAVLNRDDPWVWDQRRRTRGAAISFGHDPVEFGTFLDGNTIIYHGPEPLPRRFRLDAVSLQGAHNQENMMAAVTAAAVWGIPDAAIQRGLERTGALPHRLQLVRERDGVRFFDDSKGTNVGAMEKSLASFSGNVILLAGGYDKGGDFSVLTPLLRTRVKRLILFGTAGPTIGSQLNGSIDSSVVPNLTTAVQQAARYAAPGDTVLLSPGCASFDEFTDYAARGRRFRELVEAL